MKRVIVTGAAGFVGANLARRLLRDGHDVRLLVRPAQNLWRLDEIRHQVELVEVDLGDSERLDDLVRALRPEWVFHLAAHGAYPHQTDWRRMVAANIVGTVALVEACLRSGVEAFVNTGSSSEYGFQDHAPAETEPLEPNSAYAVTKASATMFCRHLAVSRQVHLPTLRLYSVYGPYEEPSRLMPSLIVHGLRGELPPLADPDIARDYIYIDDVLDAYCLAAARPGPERGPVYNVGTGRQISLREVVEAARAALNVKAEPRWGSMPRRAWDTSVWVADNGKLRRDLGWQPRFTLTQGLSAMAQWFRDQPHWLERYAAPGQPS